MRQAIHLEPNQVPDQLKHGYSGRKFKAVVAESVTIPMTAGLWDGGSRDVYRVVRVSDGAEMPASDQHSAPWDAQRRELKVDLQPGFAVVEHSIFCGKDAGLTFYVHPQDAAPMLPPAGNDLGELESMVLEATGSLKSSYNGKDRYQMTVENLQYGYNANKRPIPTRAQWDEAKASLIARGYLNKAGAITTAGRNARGR